MFFKRIEMHGFKSFAEPVTIEFHEGMTCVIGPNGSGKSNISDAIRWVLGEQSPKMLRGGKMEEVIFSGTANRKSRGMAEVTLVIDNSEGQLPIDYNEVALTRRMFRSGESEYAINNNQCRRRDIRELIMDTGIGVDGYSLIGQGKISDIISNKTESRREIFEEAAGVVMYRTKKAESERKLKASNDNLDRVNDIIGEIEDRIGGLKEDSIKAKEYLELRERHKELEINITLKNIENLELKNEYIKDELNERTAKLESDKTDRQKIDQTLTENKQQSENLEQLITESREKLLTSVEEINQLVNRGEVNSERLAAIENNTVRLRNELEALALKLEQEEENAKSLSGDKRQIDEEMAKVNQTVQARVQEHADASAELSRTVEEVDRKKDEIFQNHSQISAKKTEITSLENLQETLGKRKQQLLEEKDNTEDLNRETLDALNRTKAERDQLKEEQEELTADGKRLRQQYNENLISERQLSKEMEELRMSIGQLSARKKTIEEMESNYEGYNYAVKHIMKSKTAGIHGVVAELITVPKGFETAIETALGGAMQNIVCADDKSAQSAINELKKNRAGRLTFLPISSIRGGRSNYDNKLKKENGFQGFGVDCIKFDGQYTGVMEYLLGRVVIVDNMDHAVALSKKAAGLRFVTLEGEIINAGGAITGGRYKNKTANLLERKAEIADLEKQLKQKEKEKETGMNKLEAQREDIQSAADRLKTLEDAYRQAELSLLNKENEIKVTENTLNDFKENSDKWHLELERISSEQKSSQDMIKNIETDIAEKEEKVRQAEALIEEKLNLCDEKKSEIETISERITAARIEAGACESKKNNIDEIVLRITKTVDDLKTDRRSKEAELENLTAEKELLLSDHTGGEDVLKEKQEAKANLETYLEELMEERASAVAKVNELSVEKEKLDQQINTLQTQKYELEIKLAKNETQLDSHKEKLWEDFEVSYIQAMEFKSDTFVMSAAVKENRQIKNRMKELGEVNVGAISEYETVRERYEFLTTQRADILEAMDSLSKIIDDMDKTIKTKFKESFDQVVVHFESIFKELFGGGHAELRLDDENNPLESGIDIVAQPPGKKLQNINLLSGGEKTMTAIALMFAVLKTKPTPFCILDEVEAALDDANIDRFAKYLKKFKEIQFTLVTHQKTTMEHADVLYGVTMPEQGISQVLSLDLGQDFEL